MQTPADILNWYRSFTPDRQQRDRWYGDVTHAYDRVRPKYTATFLDRAFAVAEITNSDKILEVGCGPGTATTSFAQQGYSVVALEPSSAACTLAQQNLAAYPHVEIINTNFEEWEPGDRRFEAIVATTSWHWVAPEHKHQKAASLLTANGSVILLWNTGMQPSLEIFETLTESLEQYTPAMSQYKQIETQLSEVRLFADGSIESGLFTHLREEYRLNEVDYSIDDYLLLLTTYSPCIALSPADRHDLLAKLRSILVRQCGDRISLSYLSIFHVANKIATELP